jgi:hypothetical protein
MRFVRRDTFCETKGTYFCVMSTNLVLTIIWGVSQSVQALCVCVCVSPAPYFNIIHFQQNPSNNFELALEWKGITPPLCQL